MTDTDRRRVMGHHSSVIITALIIIFTRLPLLLLSLLYYHHDHHRHHYYSFHFPVPSLPTPQDFRYGRPFPKCDYYSSPSSRFRPVFSDITPHIRQSFPISYGVSPSAVSHSVFPISDSRYPIIYTSFPIRLFRHNFSEGISEKYCDFRFFSQHCLFPPPWLSGFSGVPVS